MEKARTEKARDEVLEEDLLMEANTDLLMEADAEQNNQSSLEFVDPANDLVIDPQLRDHESNTIKGADNPDINYFSNYATATLAHMPHSNGEADTVPNQIVIANYDRTDSGVRQEKHNASYSLHADCATPQASMFVPESSYPEPTPRSRDKMMGLGYYQQASDADNILLHHPDPSTPTGQDSALAASRDISGFRT